MQLVKQYTSKACMEMMCKHHGLLINQKQIHQRFKDAGLDTSISSELKVWESLGFEATLVGNPEPDNWNLVTVPSLNVPDGWHRILVKGSEILDPSNLKTYTELPEYYAVTKVEFIPKETLDC